MRSTVHYGTEEYNTAQHTSPPICIVMLSFCMPPYCAGRFGLLLAHCATCTDWSPKMAMQPGSRASISTRIGATGTLRREESESAIHGLKRRLGVVCLRNSVGFCRDEMLVSGLSAVTLTLWLRAKAVFGSPAEWSSTVPSMRRGCFRTRLGLDSLSWHSRTSLASGCGTAHLASPVVSTAGTAP